MGAYHPDLLCRPADLMQMSSLACILLIIVLAPPFCNYMTYALAMEKARKQGVCRVAPQPGTPLVFGIFLIHLRKS